MNTKRFSTDIMRSILKSTTLEYEEAYQLMRKIFPNVSFEVEKFEKDVTEQRRIKLAAKKKKDLEILEAQKKKYDEIFNINQRSS